MAYFLDNYPVSKESADLVLTEEQEKYCRIVYKLDGKGGACFTELWNPTAEYSDEFVIVPIRSTGFTVTQLAPSGTLADVKSFANVIGSNKDPLIGGKWWIQLWEEKVNNGKKASNCSSDGCFYTCEGGIEKSLDNVILPIYNDATMKWVFFKRTAACSGSIVGGHIIINAKEAATVPECGSVYIIPICNKHNIAFTIGKSQFGVGFYMKLRDKIKALKLKGYLTNVKGYK